MGKKQNLVIGIIILASILFFIFAVSLFLSSLTSRGDYELTSGGEKIALVEVTGVIYTARDIVRQLDRYNRDKSIKGIVLRIDSPGGGIAASQEIYEKVKSVRDSGKVVIASMGGVAASGGYYVACGADTIMANPGTTTGSIGVIAELPNTQELMDKIGIKFEVIKSGEYKDIGSPHRELSKDERRLMQNLIDNAYQQFVDVITTETGLSRRQVLKYADGRVFTGQQALEYGFIDTLGTYEDAVNLAADAGGISGRPRTVKERERRITIFDLLFQDVRSVFESIQRFPRIKYQVVM
ncbi:signal peptide peptidase SppA [candidate division KSB1 bacterium]|nr:signal peptide peptidase SppA [candidate division KSB1 bacterium]